MLDFNSFTKDIVALKDQESFSKYLESCFSEIEEFFTTLTLDEIDKIKFNLEEFLYDLEDYNLINSNNSKIINSFLILLAQKFEQASLIGAITIVLNHLPQGATRKRLEASKLYIRVNDISKDYFNRSDNILTFLDNASKDDEYNKNSIQSFYLFIKYVFLQFKRVQNSSIAQLFLNKIINTRLNFQFLKDESLNGFFENIEQSSIDQVLEKIQLIIDTTKNQTSICTLDNTKISKEENAYSQKLYSLISPTFESIRNIAYKYIQSIGDPQELYDRLQRGEKIIDDEVLLYKYLVSFGGKHKSKLYSACDEIISKIQNEKLNIIDWGCGQATATMLLLNYAREKNINLDIENITLIEPSKLALSRGLLHIDILKQKEYNLKAINSDLDCIQDDDIFLDNQNKTLHLFSNILDIETFKLDKLFLQKVSSTFQSDNIFVCVSPYRNDKLNNRLDLFFKYFDENFDTELISSRDTNIENATRYERIFEVKYTSVEVVEEKREELEIVQKRYQLDIIDELKNYTEYVVPILDMQMLENSMNLDPEYAIFKIRKVAEVITSKIYSKYETNTSIVSFNDKIRYLSYEKKVFDKSITNYVQTLRTIGNRGVHETHGNISKLKLDAHLMIVALISFLNEILERKLII